MPKVRTEKTSAAGSHRAMQHQSIFNSSSCDYLKVDQLDMPEKADKQKMVKNSSKAENVKEALETSN